MEQEIGEAFVAPLWSRKGSGKLGVFPWRKDWENRGFPRSEACHIGVNDNPKSQNLFCILIFQSALVSPAVDSLVLDLDLSIFLALLNI